nr:CDP-glycerol glycerophosphotransferase family protein [Eubacterium sp.]
MRSLSGLAEDFEEYLVNEEEALKKPSAKRELSIFYAEQLRQPIYENTVFFLGNNSYGLTGNPKAILTCLLKDKRFGHYRFIVCLRNERMVKDMKKKGYGSSQIQYMYYDPKDEKEFYQVLARAQYLVVDGLLPTDYVAREEQTYIQASFLYTGLLQGYERESRYSVHSYGYIKNFLAADYILSPSKLYTEEILEKSYYLKNIQKGQILSCQSPAFLRMKNLTGREVRREIGGPRRGKKEIFVVGSEMNNAIDIAKMLFEVAGKDQFKNCIFYYKPSQIGYREARQWMEKNPHKRVKLVPNPDDPLLWIKRCDVILSDYNENLFYSIYLNKPTAVLQYQWHCSSLNQQQKFLF